MSAQPNIIVYRQDLNFHDAPRSAPEGVAEFGQYRVFHTIHMWQGKLYF